MWLDMDLLINNMEFIPPLENYAGKDMVLHGKPEYILQGEAKLGMSCTLDCNLLAVPQSRSPLACPINLFRQWLTLKC